MIEIYKDKKEEFRFRVKAKNNEIVAVSEGYVSKQGCRKGIDSLLDNISEVKDLTELLTEE